MTPENVQEGSLQFEAGGGPLYFPAKLRGPSRRGIVFLNEICYNRIDQICSSASYGRMYREEVPCMAGKIVILDGYSLMYRAFHALQTPMTAPDGTPTNAVHGFVMMLLKVIEDERPDAMAVAFDLHAPTFRHRMYDGYKATRKPMPDELRAQDPVIREMIGLMGISVLECEGYEADDILGTVSLYCEENGGEALLVTGDRDSSQLSGPHTTILYTKKGITDTVRVTPEYIRENYGLEPGQLIDVKSLMGDASDNIPGVPGVGEKTALKLVQQYGSLERVLDTADSEQKGKLRERLMEGRELAEISYRLAKIDRHAPVGITPQAWRLDGIAGALPRLRELRMNAAMRRLTEVSKAVAPENSAPFSAQAQIYPVRDCLYACVASRYRDRIGSRMGRRGYLGVLFRRRFHGRSDGEYRQRRLETAAPALAARVVSRIRGRPPARRRRALAGVRYRKCHETPQDRRRIRLHALFERRVFRRYRTRTRERRSLNQKD